MGRRPLAGARRRARAKARAQHHRHDRRVPRLARRGRDAARVQAHQPVPAGQADGGGLTVEGRALPTHSTSGLPGRPESQNLADILERVLDKGIVIAGDIQINLLDIELLTIKLRLLIASVDRAREMGINWWESDSSLQKLEPGSQNGQQLEQENRELRERLERLEQKVGAGGD